MTEAEWLAGDDPRTMLRFLQGFNEPQSYTYTGRRKVASERKLRLFACACARQVWDGTPCKNCNEGLIAAIAIEHRGLRSLCPTCRGSGKVGGLTDPRSRNAVEVAERFADGQVTAKESDTAANGAEDAGCSPTHRMAVWAAHTRSRTGADVAIDMVLLNAEDCLPPATQAVLLRDIFGNPWELERLQVVWKKELYQRWLTSTVLAVARCIYDNRGFEDMGILADALEEAGCTNIEMLNHCRGLPSFAEHLSYLYRVESGPHVRGCWVLDLILGKA